MEEFFWFGFTTHFLWESSLIVEHTSYLLINIAGYISGFGAISVSIYALL